MIELARTLRDNERLIHTLRELRTEAEAERDALRARVVKLEVDKEEAYRYADNLLRSFVSQHFPPNPDWKPLPDLLGVLTQIDNASTIARDYRARVAQLEDELESWKKAKQQVEGLQLEHCGHLEARVAKLEAALSGLVHRLDEIHDDVAYKSVWTVHQLHVGPYRGPTYIEALALARAALKDAPE